MRATRYITLIKFINLLAFLSLTTSNASANSACPSSAIESLERDARKWNSSTYVFVGRVVASSTIDYTNSIATIEHTLEVEEQFKGAPISSHIVSAKIAVDGWNSGVEIVEIYRFNLAVGDRILVFSPTTDISQIEYCSASRVLEGPHRMSYRTWQATRNRLLLWQKEPHLRR